MARKTKTVIKQRKGKKSRKNKRTKTRKQNNRKNIKKYVRKMIGGEFSDDDKNHLRDLGFTEQQINILEAHPVLTLDMVIDSLHQNNPNTRNRFTPAEIIESIHNVDNENENENPNVLDISDISDEGSLHNLSIGSINNTDSMDTTRESFSSFGSLDSLDNGSGLNPSDLNLDMNDDDESRSLGGKKRKTRKYRKSYKGGACYGTGVGANCYDPNFSIYNTRELQLFPYRPVPKY